MLNPDELAGSPADPTAPPRDFRHDHDRLAAKWGYRPTIVPRRTPYEQSRQTDPAPARGAAELSSMEALRASRQRGASHPSTPGADQ